ncbi:MAG: hypothetical protein ACYDA3_05620 [Gaiellaceae bacterium]
MEFFEFVEGPNWASDLAKIEVPGESTDRLMFAIQDLLTERGIPAVSHPLGSDTDVREIRSREFPSLGMPALYATFRVEAPGVIELRRIFTEEDIRMGLHLEVDVSDPPVFP